MTVYNYDFQLSAEGEESSFRQAAGADRFGLQIIPNEAATAFTVTLQGSIDGENWADVVEANQRTPMVGSGNTAKSLVVRYLRVVARTLTGDGAAVAVHVVAK